MRSAAVLRVHNVRASFPSRSSPFVFLQRLMPPRGPDSDAMRLTSALAPSRLFALALVLFAQLEFQWPDFAPVAPAPADRAAREFRVVLLASDYRFHEACVTEEVACETDASVNLCQSSVKVGRNKDLPQGVAERSVGDSRQMMHCSVESLGASSPFVLCDLTRSACCLLKSVIKLLSSSMSNRSTSSTVPPVSGVYSGLGASVALIRFGDEPADWAASDLFLDVVGLAEGPDWAGAVRSTTAGADAGGLADEWREERRSMFAMIDVAAGECGADSEARLGEGEAIGDVERVVGINGAEVGTAGKKKDETRPINGGLAIAAVVNMSDGGENAGRRSSQTEGYGRAWGGMRAEFEAAVDDGADDGCRALHDDGRDV
ncbi:MAG: hypothetical protein M1839_001035 [Geoglossum umbratile]|nr:MAG: hypothetical protein M1839_001035 [Geoglossum umbratile]